ncbi:MAG: hypothetical protein ACO3NZ_15845 [Pirellulales bacterium]
MADAREAVAPVVVPAPHLGGAAGTDLTVLTPDYVIQLSYVAFLMKSAESPHEREAMRRLWEHFLALNDAHPPTTKEGLFLDRIEAIAFTAAELIYTSREQYDRELRLADDEYNRDMGREVAIGLTAGVWGATAKVGILIGVGAFAGLLFKGVAGFTEKAVEEAANGAPNTRLTTVSLAIAVGTTLLGAAISKTIQNRKTYRLHREHREQHRLTKLRYGERVTAAVQYVEEQARHAWIDFTGRTAAELPPCPMALLLRSIVGDTREQPVPPTFYEMTVAVTFAPIVRWLRRRQRQQEVEAAVETGARGTAPSGTPSSRASVSSGR